MYIYTCMHTCAHIHIYVAYDYRKSYNMRECGGKSLTIVAKMQPGYNYILIVFLQRVYT